MHIRTWFVAAIFATVAILTINPFGFLVPFGFGGYSYAQLLGWCALCASALLVIQGFWKARVDRRYMLQLRANASDPDRNHAVAQLYTEARVYGWQEMHVALSILVTFFVTIHGIFLLPSLTMPTTGAMLGVASFAFLVVLGFSGIALEARRKSKGFGPIKKLHLWLMVAALALGEIHAIMTGSTLTTIGTSVTLWLLVGAIGSIGVGVEYALLNFTRRLLKPNFQRMGARAGGIDLARRAAIQKLGMLAAGIVVAVAFGGAAEVAAGSLPSVQQQTQVQSQQSLSQRTVVSQTGANAQNTSRTGFKIGNIANIPVNSSIYFRDPQGNQDLLVRLQNGNVAAYSSTCTHRPCTVGYDSSSGLIRCPCHGAAFDPSRGATVLQGPARYPLPSVNVTVNSNGDIWLAQ